MESGAEIESDRNATTVDAARIITQRKQPEKPDMVAARLAAIVESSDDAIISKDLEGIITSWNHGAEKIFGYTAGEMVGTSILRLIPVEQHDEEKHILETLRSGKSVRHFETLRLTKEGRRIDVSVTVSPIKNASGRIIGISKVARDITERKRIEAEILKLNADLELRVKERTLELAKSETRLRLATEAADIGIWDWDITKNEVRWDKMMYSIYGMTESGNGLIRYEDWKAHVHPDDVVDQEASLRGTIERGERNHREFRIIRDSDRATRIIRASDAAIAGVDGKTERVVGINVDISETVERLDKIQQLNASLQIRAAEMEASVKELDAFSYSISHDLRAPLRAIDGFSRIVEEDYASKLDDEGRRMIGVVRGEAQRMGRLIDDLLTFSRLGRQKSEPVTIDMGVMARKAFEELVTLESGRSIHLNLHPIPPAFGTEAMIRQLWINLIGNAVKFTGKRKLAEIEIGVMSGEQGEAGTHVYFVRDNGVGFDMRYSDKLFGVFQRLHSQEEFPGTGVGLALVQRIIERHGGRVWGEGEVNKGATFYFTIPDSRKKTTNMQ